MHGMIFMWSDLEVLGSILLECLRNEVWVCKVCGKYSRPGRAQVVSVQVVGENSEEIYLRGKFVETWLLCLAYCMVRVKKGVCCKSMLREKMKSRKGAYSKIMWKLCHWSQASKKLKSKFKKIEVISLCVWMLPTIIGDQENVTSLHWSLGLVMGHKNLCDWSLRLWIHLVWVIYDLSF